MRKKIYLLLVFMIIFILINQIINIRYDLNLYEYIKYSRPLSEQEKKLLGDKGTIVCVSDRNAPPISFIEEENGQYRGLVIDYITALSIELGADIEFKPLIWEDALDSLAKGEADICDVFPSLERRKNFNFSKSIYKLKGIILVNASNNKVQKVEDLKQKKVAMPGGDYSIEYLNRTISDIQYVLTKDIHEALLLLQDDKVEAVVGDEPVISYFINEMGIRDDVKILDDILYEQDVALAVPKSEEKLLKIFNKGIFSLRKKDFVLKIQQRWFGISDSIGKSQISDNLVVGISFFFIVSNVMLFVLYLFNKTLKEKVDERTYELLQSRKELQVTFDALSLFLIIVDFHGRIKNCNKSFQNYLKKEKKDIIGTHFSKWEILKYLDKKQDVFRIYNNEITAGEEEIRYKNGYYIVNIFSLESIKESSNQLLIMIKDITEFKFMEKQLLQENKMAAVGQLAAGVAHEIRNPLGLIRNYCYVLRSSLRDEDLYSMDVIESSVERIDRIINNLLDFSRVSENYWTTIDIKEAITNILELEEKNMAKRDIKWQIVCDNDIKLYTNEESLKHIIINIISNSINAIEGGGWINIMCKKVEKGIILKFEDSGRGIQEENLEHIFNPFFTTRATGEGTGLGLYIVYNEIQKLGGIIEVRSQYNTGTTFEVFLPQGKEG